MMMVQKGFTEEEAIERAGKVFESLDKNNDGGLAEDEFVKVHSSTNIRAVFTGPRCLWGPVYGSRCLFNTFG